MKSVFLFRTKFRMYWVLLPLLALLLASIYYNRFADNLLKLYPIITVTICGMIFILIYFFRGIKISYDEIRDVGLFSGHDSAIINEGKTLIFKIKKRGQSLVLFLHVFAYSYVQHWQLDLIPNQVLKLSKHSSNISFLYKFYHLY